MATGGAKVNISDLVVDGTGNGLAGCSWNLVGIYYEDASGVINHVVRDIRRRQTLVHTVGANGDAIYAESDPAATPGTYPVTVENSSVHDFQKNGITGNLPGVALMVTGNEVRGQGPTTGAGENGIQIGFGATGTIKSNTVIDEIWAQDTSSDTGDAASGILAHDSAGVIISSNHVGNTQFGIAVVGDGNAFSECLTTAECSADDATISRNVVDGTLIFDGIDVCGSTLGTITGNTVAGSTESGIHLDGTCAPVASGAATPCRETSSTKRAPRILRARPIASPLPRQTQTTLSTRPSVETSAPPRPPRQTCGHKPLAPRSPGRSPQGPREALHK